MNQTEQSWQQELAEINTGIDTLRQRREAQQAELRALQESGAAAPNEPTELEPTQPYRANFLSCKLDETEQRLCTLELRQESLTLKLRIIERLKQG